MTPIFELLDATPTSYLACSLAIIMSAATHRVTGQGFGMICAPVIALVAPSHVPALILLCAVPVMIYSFRGDWDQIRWCESSFALAGRVAGALLAAAAIAAVADEDFISICIALTVLLGVAVSVCRVRIPIDPVSLIIAGLLSGVMGTITSIGTPPLGLLYQWQPAGDVRATLNAIFFFGALTSIVSLLAFSLIGRTNLLLAAGLLPAMGVGVTIGDLVLRRFDIQTLRPFVLGVSMFAAFFLLMKAVLF